MESTMNNFDIDQPLPPVIAIKSAKNRLYSIGLSLFSFGSQTRNKLQNPFFISIIFSVTILKTIIAILIDEDKYKSLLIGDYTYFLNDRYIMNASIILFAFLALSSQILHYWKYYKNDSPSYLKPFEMISGLVSPKSIGLINREHINQLLKKSKLMFNFSRIMIIGMTFGCFCV
jgi:hypothetical protein